MGGGGGHHGGHQFNYRRQLLLQRQQMIAEEEDYHLTGNLTQYVSNYRTNDKNTELGELDEEEKDWDEHLAALALDNALVTALESAANRSSTNLEWPERLDEESLREGFDHLHWQRLLREKLTSEVARIQQRHSKGATASATSIVSSTPAAVGNEKTVKGGSGAPKGSSSKTGAAAVDLQQDEAARAAYLAHEEALLRVARKPEELLAAGVITLEEATAAKKPYRPPGEGIPCVISRFYSFFLVMKFTLNVFHCFISDS